MVVPSFTFVFEAANAFALRGARLVFCDVRADTLNLDETKLPGLDQAAAHPAQSSPSTMPAWGRCEMDAICALADLRRHRRGRG